MWLHECENCGFEWSDIIVNNMCPECGNYNVDVRFSEDGVD